MGLIIFLFLSGVLFVCEGLHVLDPSGPLIVKLGGSAMLPCYIEAASPLEELEVEWKRTDSETLVHLFQDGEGKSEAQDPAYIGRASFFTGEVERGNFSLLLTNLTAEDAGVYNCFVYSQQESGQTFVEIEFLIVTGGHSVSVHAREDVTLNCSVDSHIPPELLEEVSWTKVDQDITVQVLQEGVMQTNFTHERFRDRVEFFGPEEISKGNFSLRLKDLRMEDKGLYRCEVLSGEFSAQTNVEIHLGLHVLGPSGPLIVALGDSVMLPCYVEAPLALEELVVEWKRTDSRTLVHLFQDRGSRPEAQDPAYSGRASFFTGEVERGNFSLLLTNLTAKDAGIYNCSVNRQQETGQTLVDIEYLIVTGGHAVSAHAREDVTLNCFVDSHVPPELLEEVSWTKVDQDITVLVFQKGVIQIDFTHERFRDRVEFFGPEEISKGNFPLRLKALRMQDKGLYRCEVRHWEVSAQTTVKIHLSFSYIHYVILVLSGFTCVCGSVLLLGCIPYTICKNPGSCTVIIQQVLVFGPNILMFVAFVLWGVLNGVRFFSEAATYMTINLLRILRLVLLCPCFYRREGNLHSLIAASPVLEYIALSVIADLVLGLHGWRTQNKGWMVYAGCALIMNFLCFLGDIVLELTDSKLILYCESGLGVFHVLSSFIVLLVLFLTPEMFEANGNVGLILLIILSMCILILLFIVFGCAEGLKDCSKPPEQINILFTLGVAVLFIVNSVTLAVDVLSQAGEGERPVEDLRLILLPSEMAFVVVCSCALCVYKLQK
ncbi:hypothetical protein AOLI_G00138850 [Acnodon oligacanthus]